MSALSIRTMTPADMATAIAWAAAEGWNPGLADGSCFATVDMHGFLIGEIDGVPAATISCVNYDPHFSFLGFYIVRPDQRGRGHGLRIWQAAMAHAGPRVIGLDGVVAQQDNYAASGFGYAYANIRFGGTPAPMPDAGCGIVSLEDIPLAALVADDASVFPAPRGAFLEAWRAAPGHAGRALLRDGALAAWGVIRPCQRGMKIGPLVADDRAAAESVLAALISAAAPSEIFIDVPSPNAAAVALAESLGLAPVFETARMYKGPAPTLRLDRIFGVTTFELG